MPRNKTHKVDNELSQGRSNVKRERRGTPRKTISNSTPTRKNVSNSTPAPEKPLTENAEFRNMVANTTSLYRSRALQDLLNPRGKDINQECGYPDVIQLSDYKQMYTRSGVAKRVVRVLPEETWSMTPTLFETEDSENTEFEKIWKNLQKERKIWSYLQKIDVMSGIGQFGILLLGISDGAKLFRPVKGINPLNGEATGKNNYELIYLKAFDQTAVKIKEKETNTSSPRYGLPTKYEIVMETASTVSASRTLEVHWTRVIHVADGREASEVYGTPRMESVFNRLLDVRKIMGGSGEMFWKGGFPGLSFETQGEPGTVALDTDSIKKQVTSYMNGLQRYLATEGLNVNSLDPQVSSPKEHIETNMRSIAVSLGIPYRIFLGTEEAKLASGQDARTWNKRVKARQDYYVTPYIIRPFVDRLIAFGVFPATENYVTRWPDLNTPSDTDKAQRGKTLTEAIVQYIQAGADAVVPPNEFLTLILGLSKDEVKAIEKASKDFAGLEEATDKAIGEQKRILDKEPKDKLGESQDKAK